MIKKLPSKYLNDKTIFNNDVLKKKLKTDCLIDFTRELEKETGFSLGQTRVKRLIEMIDMDSITSVYYLDKALDKLKEKYSSSNENNVINFARKTLFWIIYNSKRTKGDVIYYFDGVKRKHGFTYHYKKCEREAHYKFKGEWVKA